jgi:hypothetical protein
MNYWYYNSHLDSLNQTSFQISIFIFYNLITTFVGSYPIVGEVLAVIAQLLQFLASTLSQIFPKICVFEFLV